MRSFCGERQQIKEVFKVGTGMALNTETEYYMKHSYILWSIHTFEIYQVLAISLCHNFFSCNNFQSYEFWFKIKQWKWYTPNTSGSLKSKNLKVSGSAWLCNLTLLVWLTLLDSDVTLKVLDRRTNRPFHMILKNVVNHNILQTTWFVFSFDRNEEVVKLGGTCMRMPSSPSLWLLSDVVERADKAGLGDFARGRAIRASAVTWRCGDDNIL